jgi:hypothetical protein
MPCVTVARATADVTLGSRKKLQQHDVHSTPDTSTPMLRDAAASSSSGKLKATSATAAAKRGQEISEDTLPLQHVITAELYMPRDFAASLLVHVAQEPALINVLQVGCYPH